MLIEEISIDKIIPYARNPRKNDGAVAKVAASIMEYGFRQPIVVDKNMVVVAGHTRLDAARQLHLVTVPVHIANELTEQQIKAYRIADNRVAQDSEWENELLELELQEVGDLFTGFSEQELKKLFMKDSDTDPEGFDYTEKYEVVIECDGETQQEKIYQQLTEQGYKCRVLSI